VGELETNNGIKYIERKHLCTVDFFGVDVCEYTGCRLQLKCDGTRRRTWGEVKGKLANGVGSQYPSHYLGTWCLQHYYGWCAHLGCQYSTELTPPLI